MSSNWAFCQTRFENSGVQGARAPVPSQEVGYALDTSFWLITVTSVPYPFRLQMAKVEPGEVRRIIQPDEKLLRAPLSS